MFWANFEKLCTEIGKSPNAVATELGIPSGSITAWSKGTKPRNQTIKKIADYFGVTAQTLLLDGSAVSGNEASLGVNYDRIWALCKETGKKRSYLSKAMGHSERYLLDARKQNTNIKQEELRILASELNTTPEYLTGETDDKNPPKKAEDEIDRQFANLFRSLSPDKRDLVINLMQKLQDRQESQGALTEEDSSRHK